MTTVICVPVLGDVCRRQSNQRQSRGEVKVPRIVSQFARYLSGLCLSNAIPRSCLSPPAVLGAGGLPSEWSVCVHVSTTCTGSTRTPPVQSVDVPVEPSLVGPPHILVMVGRYHHVCWLKVSLVWYVAPSCLHVRALPVVLAEVVHGRGEGENLQVGVLPHHGPAPSIQVHVTIHL